MSDKPNKLLEQFNLKSFWQTLSPNQRRFAVVVSVASVVLLGIGLLSDDNESHKTKQKNASIKRSVLTDTDTRTIGIDALNAKVKAVTKENDELHETLGRLQQDITDMKQRRGNDPDMTRQFDAMKEQLNKLSDKAKSLGWEVEDIKDGYLLPEDQNSKRAEKSPVKEKTQDTSSPAEPPVELEQQNNAPRPKFDPSDATSYFRTPPVRPVSSAPLATVPETRLASQQSQPAGALVIVTVQSEHKAQSEEKKQPDVFLPAGSILTGVLLNGIDAPTGRNARKQPFPVLVRVQKDAILPNSFRADVKECFLTMGGYGEMSSERAYLRGETFSCVTKSGDVIEEDFPGYAVGEDGKTGVRGRLVTRTGSLIAKTALAGFAAAGAAAFGSSPVPVIQTGGIASTKTFQDNLSSQSVNYGLSSGASASMSRLADYFMDMADQIFPVIEVDGGRQVDIVLQTGFSMTINNAKVAQGANKTTNKTKKRGES